MKDRWNIQLTEANSLGESLRIIKAQKKEGSLFDQELWYQGAEKYFNIFIGVTKQEIEWVQLTFRGAYLEYRNGSVVTGTTSEYSGSAMDGTPSKLLHRDSYFNVTFLRVGLGLLQPLESDPRILDCAKLLKPFAPEN